MNEPLVRVAMLFFGCMAAFAAIAAEETSLPQKLSAYDGWHGAKIEMQRAPMCKLVLPKGFGSNPAEFQLLLEMAKHNSTDAEIDIDCEAQMVKVAAWDRVRQMAIQGQNRAAAVLILSAMENTEKLGIDGEFGETFGETYLYPVLLGYRNLSEVVTPKMEKDVAGDICSAYYTSDGNTMNLQTLKESFKKKNMLSLLNNLNRECKRFQQSTE